MKKLSLFALAFLFVCTTSFAQEVKVSTNKKETQKLQKTDLKSVDNAGTKKSNDVPVMPQLPKVDPKVWDFVPNIVATVGDTNITKDQLVKVLNPQVQMLLAMGQKITEDQYKTMAKNMADELVKVTVVKSLAAKDGYKVTPDIEEETYQKFSKRFETQLPKDQHTTLADILQKQGLDVKQVKEQMAEGEVIQNWIKNKIVPNITVADETVNKFYADNKDNYFKRPETITLSDILIKAKKGKSGIPEDIQAKADDILKQLKNGATFADMAKKYSEAPNASRDGKIGTVAKGQMLPEIDTASWKAVENNQLNKPEIVKTKIGDIYIVQVTAHDKGGYIALDDALKKDIKEQLKQEEIGKKLKRLIDDEIKKVKPVVDLK